MEPRLERLLERGASEVARKYGGVRALIICTMRGNILSVLLADTGRIDTKSTWDLTEIINISSSIGELLSRHGFAVRKVELEVEDGLDYSRLYLNIYFYRKGEGDAGSR